MTTQEILNWIKPFENSSDSSFIDFFFAIRRALSLLDATDEHLVLKTAAQNFVKSKIEVAENESWEDFKQKMFVTIGINEDLETLRMKLNDIQLQNQSLEIYYKEVCRLVKFLTILEYDQRDWREFFFVIIETEKKGVEAFIEGMRTGYATYLMLKNPSNLQEAYNLIKKRMKKDQTCNKAVVAELVKKISDVQLQKPKETARKLCATIFLETSLTISRRFLFHVWQEAPANFIKVSSLPFGTLFSWVKTTIKSFFGDIETIGTVPIFIYLSKENVIGPFPFYVLPEKSKIEDDGIIMFKFGNVEEMEDGFKLTVHFNDGSKKAFELGKDCPKRGKCGHWPEKLFNDQKSFK